jgi:dephospho-CoA kinase
MLKVGLTGSIAVGKTFISQVFRELGCPVLDADLTARQVVEPHTRGWQKIVEIFGTNVLNSDLTLNRAKLGTIVFNNAERREQLNQIVHPLVFAAQNEWLAAQTAAGAKIAIIDAALMIESGSWQRFDKIIVAWCKPAVQLERLMRRNNLTADEAQRRINAQMPQTEKKKIANFLIETTDGFAETRRQVENVYGKLLILAENESS